MLAYETDISDGIDVDMSNKSKECMLCNYWYFLDKSFSYENDKERLREQARNKYRNLSEEDKKKKREYGKNRYHNMSEEKKQELKEYQKRRYREAKESKNNE